MAIGLSFDIAIVLIRFISNSMVDYAAYSLGGGDPSIPRFGPQERNDLGQQIEQLVRMLFLNISELLCCGVANKLRASSFE